MAVFHRTGAWTLVLLLSASPAWAQRQAPEPSPVDDWGRGTALTLSGGVAHGSSDTGAQFGGAIAWSLMPRLAVEGGVMWLDRDRADAFNAALKLRYGVRHSGVAPFAEGGFGLYHVTASDNSALPAFYQRRLTGAERRGQSFTDPAFHFGAGVSVFVSRHIAVQPAVEAIVVTNNSHAMTVGVASIRLSYHFEDHPITPSR